MHDSACLRRRGNVAGLHRPAGISRSAADAADSAGRVALRKAARRTGRLQAAPSMTVIALVLVGNLLLAGLFSLVAITID